MRLNGKKCSRICLALLMAGLLLMQCVAMAAGTNDTSVVRVDYEDTELPPMPGVHFSVYKIAEFVDDEGYTPTEDFAECYLKTPDELGEEDPWVFTEVLVSHVLQNALQPDDVARIDEDGYVEFTGLEDGVYLITGTPYSDGKTSWFFEPSLVNIDGSSGSSEYTIKPKFTMRGGEHIDISVKKIWKNDGDHKETRAQSIEAQLYCNGNLYDTVILNEANSWRHTWLALDGLAEWHVTETTKVKGYKTSISHEGDEFIITNTYKEEGPPPDDRLPQTGLLWWPVPVLMGAGIILFIAGLMRRYYGE